MFIRKRHVQLVIQVTVWSALAIGCSVLHYFVVCQMFGMSFVAESSDSNNRWGPERLDQSVEIGFGRAAEVLLFFPMGEVLSCLFWGVFFTCSLAYSYRMRPRYGQSLRVLLATVVATCLVFIVDVTLIEIFLPPGEFGRIERPLTPSLEERIAQMNVFARLMYGRIILAMRAGYGVGFVVTYCALWGSFLTASAYGVARFAKRLRL